MFWQFLSFLKALFLLPWLLFADTTSSDAAQGVDLGQAAEVVEDAQDDAVVDSDDQDGGQLDDGYYQIITKYGQCLTVEGDDRGDGRRIIQAPCEGKPSQGFWVSAAEEEYLIFTNFENRGLKIADDRKDNFAGLIQSEQWKGEGNSFFFRLKRKGGRHQVESCLSGKCLVVEEDQPYEGTRIIQYDCHEGDNQEFRFELITPDFKSVRPMMTPVKDQADRGTCTAFATIGLFEAYAPKKRFSEQCLIYLGSETDAAYLPAIARYAEEEGLYYAADCPYYPDKESRHAIPNDLQGKRLYHPPYDLAYHEVKVDKGRFVEDEIDSGRPILISTHYPKAWWRDRIVDVSDDENVHGPPDKGQVCGHAIVLTGYNRERQLIEFRNSWGDSYADQGYGWMTYRFLEEYANPDFFITRLGEGIYGHG